MKVLVVPADPTTSARVEDVSRISLAVLTHFAGAEFLDCAVIGPGVRAWVSDTGLIDELPINVRLCAFRDVTAVAAGYEDGHPSPYPLHGDAVVVGPADAGGEETSVPNWVVDTIMAGER